MTGDDERSRRRLQMLVRRDQQLREPAVRSFVCNAERIQFQVSGPTSIFSLMRDGRELAQKIRALPASPTASDWSRVVSPYVQMASPGTICTETGLDLGEIWRYFRHTWSQPCGSTPGRSLSLLIRDSSAPHHPVIGIAALSSASAGLRERDRDIGWDDESVLELISSRPRREHIDWITRLLETSLAEVYTDDLVVDDLMPTSIGSINDPSSSVRTLRAEAAVSRAAHRADRSEHGRRPDPTNVSPEEWIEEARTHLFRAKRAEEIADIIEISAALGPVLASRSPDDLRAVVCSGVGRRALAKLFRRAKARSMGTAIADLSVCGALPPYSCLLGGKLVALLAISPEVIRIVKERYSKSISVIASAMAGRPICRTADLVYISTTSLYGVRPCQYDRVRIPAAALGGPSQISIGYRLLAHTAGYGSMQFCRDTVESLQVLEELLKSERHVHHRFGEGASPRLRGIRDGLALLGVDSNKALKHEHHRLLYGANLTTNGWQYLLGLNQEAKYLFDRRRTRSSTQEICKWWFERWVRSRIRREDVLEKVASHNLIHPIIHGARVVLPRDDVDQMEFFLENSRLVNTS